MKLLRLPTLALTAAVVFAILLLVGTQDTAYAISFNPDSSVTLADPTPDANSDLVTEFCVGDVLSIHDPLCADSLVEDSNFGGVITFINPAFTVAADADVPDGALVAQLTSEATLGLLNNACDSKILVGFDLMDATTDKSNMIDPLPPGEVDVLRPLVDLDGDGLEIAVKRYPSFLETLFPGITPRARQFGWTTVTGVTDAITLNFLIFEPGTDLRSEELPEVPPLDPALGFPNVVILNDPTAPPAQSVISDFCSPLYSKTTTFGLTKDNPQTSANEGGVAYRTNPSSAGTYSITVFAASQRDADGDGIENGLDPCPLTPDPDWNPRQTMVPTGIPGDADADGLPDTCDPNPSSPSPLAPNECPGGNTGRDEDQDCFSNRQDNCPLDPNPGATAAPKAPDEDGDGIGDGCDPNPDDAGAQGEVTTLCLVSTFDIGGGGGDAIPPEPNLCGPSGVGIDLDGNGVFDSLEAGGNGTGGDGDGGGAGGTGGAGAAGTGDAGTGDAGTGAAAGGAGGPATGIGSLAPAVSSIPAWAAIASGLGGAGLLGSLAAFVSRALRRRR